MFSFFVVVLSIIHDASYSHWRPTVKKRKQIKIDDGLNNLKREFDEASISQILHYAESEIEDAKKCIYFLVRKANESEDAYRYIAKDGYGRYLLFSPNVPPHVAMLYEFTGYHNLLSRSQLLINLAQQHIDNFLAFNTQSRLRIYFQPWGVIDFYRQKTHIINGSIVWREPFGSRIDQLKMHLSRDEILEINTVLRRTNPGLKMKSPVMSHGNIFDYDLAAYESAEDYPTSEDEDPQANAANHQTEEFDDGSFVQLPRPRPLKGAFSPLSPTKIKVRHRKYGRYQNLLRDERVTLNTSIFRVFN